MDPSSNRIRERAYEIWQEQGCPDVLAEEHWLAAEREILSGGEPPLTTESELSNVGARCAACLSEPKETGRIESLRKLRDVQPSAGPPNEKPRPGYTRAGASKGGRAAGRQTRRHLPSNRRASQCRRKQKPRKNARGLADAGEVSGGWGLRRPSVR
jgi:Protein of unknown function (DUF2934)